MKKLLLFAFILFSIGVYTQNVTIPDANFKNYLLSNASINTNLDTDIQVSEANAFSGNLFIDNLSISDLTGIEAFINLKILHCYTNQLTTLNVSTCTSLTELNCSYNQLTTLNVSNNSKIKTLNARNNQLTNLNISTIDSLVTLTIQNNFISNINISNNPKLYVFYASNNNFTSLNFSSNPILNNVEIKNTLITSLDFSNNSNLQLVWLDSNINLSTLNLKNGNNTFIFPSTTTPSFLGNPNLSCIQVDDSSYSANNWTNIDAQHFFSENCSVGVDELNSDDNISIYPNPATTQLTINIYEELLKENLQLKLIAINGKIIKTQQITNKTTTIDVSFLPKGFYTLDIQNNSKVFIAKKFIISH
jgi:Leucine-rich repeat (LRR) protein